MRVFSWCVLALMTACTSSQQHRLAQRNDVVRFEALEVVLANAAISSCVRGLQPIPATVIDVGVFKNVPYQSFSNGSVELNAYGDPRHLVAVEVGTRIEEPALKTCLIEFMTAQSLFERDRLRVAAFDATPRSTTQDGLTIETTDATASDAYGAWWISLEVTEQVSSATATDNEVQTLSTTPDGWSSPPLLSTPDSVRTSSPYSTYPSYRPSGGRVYVHGYTRKDGTYVHPHTRRR